MTQKEFVAALRALGLSQMAASRLLGVEGRTVRKWVAGDAKVPNPVALCLNIMLHYGIKPEEVMEALQIGK